MSYIWFTIYALIPGALALWTLLWCQDRLRHLPGPQFAPYTNLWRALDAVRGKQMTHQIQLHKRFGPAVRIGPNTVSLADTKSISQVYGTSNPYRKSEFYTPFDAAPGMPTIFSTRDDATHKIMSRQLGTAYSVSAVREMESLNDECTDILLERLSETAAAKEYVDLSQILQWYASDVITSITFSNKLGFLDKGEDVEGLNDAIFRRMRYLSAVAQVPTLHRLLGSRLLAPLIARFDKTGKILAFAMSQMSRFDGDSKEPAHSRRDILERLKERNVDNQDILIHAVTNIFAGADTTGITLTALFFNIMRQQSAYRKLQSEIDEAEKDGRLSHPVKHAEAQTLPYLQAVIKETLRIHPAVGMLLEREVPSPGAHLAGEWIPGGTVVGINPWVASRNEIFYPEPERFLPERWLDADAEQLKRMEHGSLAFGAGSRSCTGKAISLVEISKVVPELLQRFDFQLADPDAEPVLHDFFFVWQSDVRCAILQRAG